MKPYKERLPMIDEAVEYRKGKWPILEDVCRLNFADPQSEVTRQEFEQRAKELGYPKEQEMNNDWYDKGEFPPVGTECEVNHIGEWKSTVIVGYDGELPVFKTEWNEGYKYACGDDFKFRPIRTETDKLVEQMKRDLSGEWAVSIQRATAICSHLVEAGYRKTKPMSEERFVTLTIGKNSHGLYKAGCRFIDKGE